jgi:hypothetical protein
MRRRKVACTWVTAASLIDAYIDTYILQNGIHMQRHQKRHQHARTWSAPFGYLRMIDGRYRLKTLELLALNTLAQTAQQSLPAPWWHASNFRGSNQDREALCAIANQADFVVFIWPVHPHACLTMQGLRSLMRSW